MIQLPGAKISSLVFIPLVLAINISYSAAPNFEYSHLSPSLLVNDSFFNNLFDVSKTSLMNETAGNMEKVFVTKMQEKGYLLLEEITRGSYPVRVFKAQNEQGELVTVKIIYNGEPTDYHNASEEQIAYMLNALQQDQQPAEKTFQIGKFRINTKTIFYIVSEYLEGVSVEKLLAKGVPYRDLNVPLCLIESLVSGYDFFNENTNLPYSVTADKMIYSIKHQRPVIVYYYMKQRFSRQKEKGLAETMLHIILGRPIRFTLADEARYRASQDLIFEEITQSRYNDDFLAKEIAAVIHLYLNQEVGYVNAADIYEKLQQIQSKYSDSGVSPEESRQAAVAWLNNVSQQMISAREGKRRIGAGKHYSERAAIYKKEISDIRVFANSI